jgi:hypothetical protein
MIRYDFILINFTKSLSICVLSIRIYQYKICALVPLWQNINMRYILFFIAIVLSVFATAQTNKTVSISFLPKYNNKAIQLDSVQYKLPNTNDSISFSSLRFYISSICLLQNDKIIFKEKSSFHLVDVTNNTGLNIKLSVPKKIQFNAIQLNFGIDSTTNAEGIFGKDLDPTKGMYWAWHSGFINFKLEGKSNICKTRNNAFEFHLGGFQSPFNSLQTLILPVVINNNINIEFDVFNFLKQIDISKTNEIMTPSKITNDLMQIAAKSFSITL